MHTKTIFTFLILLTLWSCNHSDEPDLVNQKNNNETPLEILLLGTFHFNNPGADVVKTEAFDILSGASQKELNELVDAIKNYGPSKIFVEWPFEQQHELDSLYQLFKEGNFLREETSSDFYRKNEIFQLAFKVAKVLGLDQVHAIDYVHTSFPFDSLMTVIDQANQHALMTEINNERTRQEKEVNDMIGAGISLKDRLVFENSDASRAENTGLYTKYLTKAGKKDNFVGAYLTAEWYRRNIYILSLLQKELTVKDERVMVLFGSAHVAVFDQLLKTNPAYKLVELVTLMKEKK